MYILPNSGRIILLISIVQVTKIQNIKQEMSLDSYDVLYVHNGKAKRMFVHTLCVNLGKYMRILYMSLPIHVTAFKCSSLYGLQFA